MKSYDFNDVYKISKEGIEKVTEYLKSLQNTLEVYNVEDYPFYRNLDIDLVWVLTINGEIILRTIEIKTDRYFNTGNYFIEIVSNQEKQTEGCILYSKSDYIFYFFTSADEIHIFNTKKLNIWFNKNHHRFTTKHTSTKNKFGEILYTSCGKIVPRLLALRQFPYLRIVKLKEKVI